MNIEIANRLVKLRKANHLSQEQLAEKVGVSRQAVSKWERAEASPDTDNLITLSKIYGISLDDMLFLEEDPELPVPDGETPGTGSERDAWYGEREGNGTNPEQERGGGIPEMKRISKVMHALPYPVFATMVYLLLGFLLNLWHPGWLIFLTVPMYYMIADAIGKA